MNRNLKSRLERLETEAPPVDRSVLYEAVLARIVADGSGDSADIAEAERLEAMASKLPEWPRNAHYDAILKEIAT